MLYYIYIMYVYYMAQNKEVTARIRAYMLGNYETTLAKVEMWNTHYE